MMEMMEDKNYSVRAEIDRKRISAREKERGSVIWCIARRDTLPLLGLTRGSRDAGKFTRYICQEDKENKNTRFKNRKNLGQEKSWKIRSYVCVSRGDNVRFKRTKWKEE